MNKYPNLDGQTLEIASLSDVPSQPVSLTRTVNKQIRQLQGKLAAPVVNSQAPLTVVRRNLGGGQIQFRVQFIAPTRAQNPDYQTTAAVLQMPNGTVRLAASSGAGPIVFNSTQTTAPGSVALQETSSNASSVVKLGTGNSRALLQAP